MKSRGWEEEVKAILVLLTRVLERPGQLPLSEAQRGLVGTVRDQLTAMVGRCQVTTGERTWLIWTARALLVAVF